MTTKAEVRRRVRALLAFPPGTAAQKSARVCAAILEEPLWKSAHTIALFASHTGEPDIDPLWAHALDKVLCYPRVDGVALDFFRVPSPAALVVSRWNLREPLREPAHLVAWSDIDLILVPGVAFTRAGERLGRGGGYYDRLLASRELRAHKWGVCFEEQLVPELPGEIHDMRVERVISDGMTSI